MFGAVNGLFAQNGAIYGGHNAMRLLKDCFSRGFKGDCVEVIKRPTLSLLENGKQMPTIDILSRFCSLSGRNTDEYFVESTTDALVYLMGSLKESDKEKVEEMAERIRIKEKYELLAKRGSYVIN